MNAIQAVEVYQKKQRQVEGLDKVISHLADDPYFDEYIYDLQDVRKNIFNSMKHLEEKLDNTKIR